MSNGSKSKTARLLDVARHTGYSVSTISIVLNDAPLAKHLRPQTKQVIREAAERLGYRPDVYARSLRQQRTNSIGVIVFDLSDPFCTLILRGIDLQLQTTEYLPIVMDAHNDRARFERYLEMLLERRAEGLIVVANWLFVKIDALKVFARNIPTVVVGRDLHRSSIPSLLIDNEAGGYLAAAHLYESGHRHIAVILGPKEISDSSRRWAGIRRFAKDSGLQLAPELTVQMAGSSDPLSGFEAGRNLTTELLQSGNHFTAILAFDDMTAFGAIRALSDSGRNVPEDCSVIGFDDIPLAALATPSLTTIRQPMQHMGAAAADRIWKLLTAPTSSPGANCNLVPPELVLRNSTRVV